MRKNGEQRTLTSNSSKEEKRSLNVKSCWQARHLVDKFEKLGAKDAKKCFSYFVKCFKSLPESMIWEIYENATNNPSVKSPIKYFIAACRNQMM